MITVYTMPGCGFCTKAKEKLHLMGKEYVEKPLMEHTVPHDGWRLDDSEGVQAAYALYNQHAPIIGVDGRYYDYSGAMKELKRSTNAEQEK